MSLACVTPDTYKLRRQQDAQLSPWVPRMQQLLAGKLHNEVSSFFFPPPFCLVSSRCLFPDLSGSNQPGLAGAFRAFVAARRHYAGGTG